MILASTLLLNGCETIYSKLREVADLIQADTRQIEEIISEKPANKPKQNPNEINQALPEEIH